MSIFSYPELFPVWFEPSFHQIARPRSECFLNMQGALSTAHRITARWRGHTSGKALADHPHCSRRRQPAGSASCCTANVEPCTGADALGFGTRIDAHQCYQKFGRLSWNQHYGYLLPGKVRCACPVMACCPATRTLHGEGDGGVIACHLYIIPRNTSLLLCQCNYLSSLIISCQCTVIWH